MPCPHFDVKIIQRSKRQSAVASAAYQSGERLFSEYDQKYAEIWRQGWADTANRYLEAIGSPEHLDLRSYARQGIDKIPTVHMGPAVSYLERKGIQTNIGNLNRDIKAANSLMQSIRQMVRSLKGWLSGLKEKKAALPEALEQAKEPTIPELLSRYLDMRSEERTGWTSKGKLKGTVGDFNKVMEALDFLRQKEISTVESLDAYLDKVSGEILSAKTDIRKSERRIKAIDTTLSHIANHGAYKEVYKKYASIGWKTRKEKFAAEHREELDAYLAAKRFFKAHQEELPFDSPPAWGPLLLYAPHTLFASPGAPVSRRAMAGMSMARSVRSARGQGSCGERFERTYSVASPARRAPSMSHRPSLPTMMLRAGSRRCPVSSRAKKRGSGFLQPQAEER